MQKEHGSFHAPLAIFWGIDKAFILRYHKGAAGALVGEYEYDAWGNLLNEPESDVLLWGPFRYRGYYYDTSIGLYYLNSRYYDPETGRFLNEDLVSCLDPETIGGINPYAYCGNNPVMGYDPEGTWNWNAFGLIVAIFASAVVGVVLTVLPGGIVGAFFGGAAIGFATSATENLVSQVSTNGWENVDYGRAWKEGFVGTVVGAVGGLFSYGISNIAGFVGRNVGLAFSQAKHIGSGIQFGKVFGVNPRCFLRRRKDIRKQRLCSGIFEIKGMKYKQTF